MLVLDFPVCPEVQGSHLYVGDNGGDDHDHADDGGGDKDDDIMVMVVMMMMVMFGEQLSLLFHLCENVP